ncbi:MAG: OB-fold nucleic acid binding domain-containing protein [Candidatus Freyarchaeota archaeon]|nr:OB-fold nucleic acid binding domain-containing protein [Candidatus Freyrarchaeum guaymaensis]
MSAWHTAYKLRISDVVNGTPEELGRGGVRIVTESGFHATRVRVMGTVVDVFKSEIGEYANLTLDDGTGTIRVKVWGEKAALLGGVSVGDVVDVIGLVRFYQGEIYLVPELIIRVSDPNWELVRELELALLPKIAGQVHVKRSSKKLREGILKIIDALDAGDGVARERLESLLNVSGEELDVELDLMLREGIIYEVREGFYRRLGGLDEDVN